MLNTTQLTATEKAKANKAFMTLVRYNGQVMQQGVMLFRINIPIAKRVFIDEAPKKPKKHYEFIYSDRNGDGDEYMITTPKCLYDICEVPERKQGEGYIHTNRRPHWKTKND